MSAWLSEWDIRGAAPSAQALELFAAAPGGVRTTEPFSTRNRWASPDTDAAGGRIRDVAHAYTAEGGLVVLHGNLAVDGAVIKTAGVDPELSRFQGPARVVESQEEAVSVILGGGCARARCWSCGTRVRPEGRACRRCCTRPRSSRVQGWERSAPS